MRYFLTKHSPSFFSFALSLSLLAASLGTTGCTESPAAPEAPAAEAGEELSGGETTVFDASENAFGYSARNLSQARREAFFVGNSFFNQNWVTAPASTAARDGLGPLFNARSCSGCHFKDGRGKPPEPDEPLLSLLFRLSVEGATPTGAPLPEPMYGGQLQGQSISGVMPEGDGKISYTELSGTFPDGEAYRLRVPAYRIENLKYGALSSGVMLSPRVAPQMIGMGLLEAIPESAIRAAADETDANGDGISGKANTVWDALHRRTALGRFGWKANQPGIPQQVADAFNGDLGITSPFFLTPNSTASQRLDTIPNGGEPEIEQATFEDVVFYSRMLAVPARRGARDEAVLRGKALFNRIGCAACHTPEFQTGNWAAFPELSAQTVRPYTDLLLHDMGAELSDGRPDFQASGSEWRTPPLWGIGLVQTVNRHTYFLHDGRARNLTEALLWHGGEGFASREAFKQLSRSDRAALLRFLESL